MPLRFRTVPAGGLPDHLERIGEYLLLVEPKLSNAWAWASHIMQIAAECLLVQEVYGVRPPYGILVFARGVQERVPLTHGP